MQGKHTPEWMVVSKPLVGAQFLPGILDAKDVGHFLYQSAHGKRVSLTCGIIVHILTLHCHIRNSQLIEQITCAFVYINILLP